MLPGPIGEPDRVAVVGDPECPEGHQVGERKERGPGGEGTRQWENGERKSGRANGKTPYGVIGQGGWDGKHGFRIKSGMTVVRAGDGAGMTNWAVTGATGWVPANAERGGVGRPDAGRAWHRDRGVMDRGWTHTVRRDLSAC